jgi:hypothetical protein
MAGYQPGELYDDFSTATANAIWGVWMMLVGVIGSWRFVLHPSIGLTPTRVVVTNPFRTVSVDRSKITRVSNFTNTVTIYFLNGEKGRKVSAWASHGILNFSSERHPGRSGRIAAAIRPMASADNDSTPILD